MHAAVLLLSSLAALAAAAPAVVGNAAVKNLCNDPSYLFSVDPSTVGPQQNLSAHGGAYREVYRGSGIVLKLSKTPGSAALYNPNVPLTQFQYTLDGSTVYYSLADTRGDPYAGHKVVLAPSDPTCATVTWSNGTGPSSVFSCGAASTLMLTLCAP